MSNDDEDDNLKPKDSKCWTCKHGMCLQEKDLQSFFQPGMVEGDPFEGKPEQPGMTEATFPTYKVRSVCFWRPTDAKMLSPLVFNLVTECSHYEK